MKSISAVVLAMLFAAGAARADMPPGPWTDDPVSDPFGNPNPVPPPPKPSPGTPDTPPSTANDGWRPKPITTALLTFAVLTVGGVVIVRRTSVVVRAKVAPPELLFS